jgi:hypothetical protein
LEFQNNIDNDITMGDRSTVRIGGLCRDLPIRLGYEVFIIDAYISTLDDMIDVILGTPWLASLDPITWVFSTLTMHFRR